jgi:hypothetical protein
MGQIDPSNYISNLSPLDLYDSIFWGMLGSTTPDFSDISSLTNWT